MRARMRDIAMGASWSWGLMLLVHVMTMMLSASYSMSSQSAGTAAAAAMRVAELEQLRKDFYNGTCPQAEEIIRRSVTRAVRLDPTAPAALLRLAFHDCQVGACDASILLDSVSKRGEQGEREAPGNMGIRRLDIIDAAKQALEAQCPNTVSCADIVALAARDAVALAGGPAMAIPLGRKDALSASASNADAQLPSASGSVDAVLHIFFTRYGLSLAESVAIMGAHTLGVGHCVNVVDRVQPTRDPTLSTALYLQVKAVCGMSKQAFLPNDLTSLSFDNRYFKDLGGRGGLFAVDSNVARDARTQPLVESFAADEQLFFRTFAGAFEKMVCARVLTGRAGEVRSHCHQANDVRH